MAKENIPDYLEHRRRKMSERKHLLKLKPIPRKVKRLKLTEIRREDIGKPVRFKPKPLRPIPKRRKMGD